MNSPAKAVGKLFLSLLFLICFWILACLVFGNQALIWLVLLAVLSLPILIRDYRRLSKRDWLTAGILGLLVLFSNPIFAVLTVMTCLSSCLLLKDQPELAICVWPKSVKKITQALVLGLIIGLLLGWLNLFLAHMPLRLPDSFRLSVVLDALRASVFEELTFRLFFLVFLVHLTKKATFSKRENVLVYSILTLPHTLLHFSLASLDLGSVLILSLLFGLPFENGSAQCYNSPCHRRFGKIYLSGCLINKNIHGNPLTI